jgi:hypothetical protein
MLKNMPMQDNKTINKSDNLEILSRIKEEKA